MTAYDRWLEAPYTDAPEQEECEECQGDGWVNEGPDGSDTCERCDGTGYVDPPTREEIKERMDEEKFDLMRDEGEI